MKNRVGEKNKNSYGSEMEIIEYRSAVDIDVFFPKDNCIVKNKRYSCFLKGTIKNPFDRTVCGVGYIGQGKYEPIKNNVMAKSYKIWRDMLKRCYGKNEDIKNPSYKEVYVCNEWHNYQLFAEWFEKNYYEINGKKMCLDKDILVKGNKEYSPNTSIFVPQEINVLFISSNSSRGAFPIGVSYHKKEKKFYSRCCDRGTTVTIGTYGTSYDAFIAYKKYKENLISEIAEEYKDSIPLKLYNAMKKYKVEITD